MRIAIITTGRFHVCDLGRELDALGHEVAFYSLVPPWRTRRFGLPRGCNRWILPAVTTQYAASRIARGTRYETRAAEALREAVDASIAARLERCDVVVAVSGMFPRSQAAARQRYGSKVFVERGSRHILSQQEILNALPRGPDADPPVSDAAVARELADYESADTIVVPSRHVVRSFEERGVPGKRLFRNPYGVSLSMFAPTLAPVDERPSILMVGQWSLRKGVDILVDAWRRMADTRLVHVGVVGDAPLPLGRRFTHHEPVDQVELRRFYARAHVFALASREEGLALVQAQALACGVPVVCTDRTGGEDLRELLGLGDKAVRVVPPEDPEALWAALLEALGPAVCQRGRRDLLGPEAAQLSWQSYGNRYHRALQERV
jgi:alpha-maltose-1-phosphate synthase